MERRGILFEKQSEFCSEFSTKSCVILLCDLLKQEVSTGNNIGMVLIDLQKAFDMIDHGFLLSKLKSIGGDSVDWYQSYLLDWCVFYQNRRS